MLSVSLCSLRSVRESFLYFSNFYLQQNPTPRFLRKWGQFNNPRGVAVLAWSQDQILTRSQDRVLARSQDRGLQKHPHLDLVFVADTNNHRIRSFHCDGTAVKQWGTRGTGDGQLWFPHSVAVLRGHPTCNWIFITDSWNHRIQVFDVDGVFIRKWDLNGQFDFPLGVAVLARSQNRSHPTRDLVYITDNSNCRVQVFDADGTFIRKWGTSGSDDGQFHRPDGVVAHPTRDLIFISDSWNHRIQAFRSDGTFLFKWGSQGFADGQFQYPKCLALHPSRDLLFVADDYRVQVFDLNGSFVSKWGSQRDGDGQGPQGISVHPSDDVVYVSGNNCVQAFSLFPTRRKCQKVCNV